MYIFRFRPQLQVFVQHQNPPQLVLRVVVKLVQLVRRLKQNQVRDRQKQQENIHIQE
jgi:hypothetical protein